MPAALTTYSHSMSPTGVRTPTTAPSRVRTSSAGVPSRIVAPRIRAPLARAIVTSTGFTRPSVGVWKAARMSSVRAIGNSSPTSRGLISCTSTPQCRLNAETRRYSSRRPASAATSISPIGRKPVAWPVSASSREYRSLVYIRSSVEVCEVEPNVTIRPAACHVVPEVSRSRSSSTVSVQPSWARW